MSNVSYLPEPQAEPLAPHSVEAEQQLLGAILLDQSRISLVEPSGGEALFYDPVHAAIYAHARDIDRQDMLVSPVALSAWAEGQESMRDLGGRAYLVRLAGASVSADQCGHYVDLLSDFAAKRKLVAAMDAARADIAAGQAGAGVISGRLEAALMAQEAHGKAPRPVSMMAAVHKAVEESWAVREGETSGCVPSGISALDRMIGGFYPGEMTLLGGRPSMGKTALALSIALNAARAGNGVVICSLEMNPEAMALRAISEATARQGRAITYANMRRGEIPDHFLPSWKEAAQEVAGLPIQFLSRAFADIGAITAGAKQAKRAMGDNMKLFVVDYAQLLRSSARSRYEQITEISMALKALSGSLDVPVLALSQLSRQVEQRDDKRPIMADLRESGQLEQDADAVMFCYRDEYYLERDRPDEGKMDEVEAWQHALDRARNKLEIIVAKQRQGEIGTAHVFCNPALNRVWEP